jgi:Bacterial capsule synthesis protein PGA_cap
MSSDPDAEQRRVRRAELRRRQVRRRRATVAALLIAVAGVGVWAAATLASGHDDPPATTGTDSVATIALTGITGETTASVPTTAPTAPATAPGLGKRSVTIAWVGDTVLASSYGTPPGAGRRSMAGVVGPLRGADLAFANLEETLSQLPETKCGGSPNCFAFQAPPSYARLMTAAGFDVMNLANNHADDFGPAGQRSTERALKAAGLRWTGRPGQIAIMRRNGLRIALLGFAPYRWAARLEHIRVAQALVRRAATQADLVVVAMHAGAEGSNAMHVPHGTETFLGENRGDSRRFAHAVVDAGADLVVGSGPHVIRGVERYHGRLIAYSTGNFAGYKNFGTGGMLSLSAILRVRLRGDGGFAGGTWVSLRLDGNALPHSDPSHASAHLAARLSREDFGSAAAQIASDGTIRP